MQNAIRKFELSAGLTKVKSGFGSYVWEVKRFSPFGELSLKFENQNQRTLLFIHMLSNNPLLMFPLMLEGYVIGVGKYSCTYTHTLVFSWSIDNSYLNNYTKAPTFKLVVYKLGGK